MQGNMRIEAAIKMRVFIYLFYFFVHSPFEKLLLKKGMLLNLAFTSIKSDSTNLECKAVDILQK